MYKVNELAKMFCISTQTVHYYEKKKLLYPKHVDSANGYRYYGIQEINRLNTIIQLRSFGYRINEIQKYIANQYTHKEKINDLEETIKKCQLSINLINMSKNIRHEISIKIRPQFDTIFAQKTIYSVSEIYDIYNNLLEESKILNLKVNEPVCFFVEYIKRNSTQKSVDINAYLAITYNDKKNKMQAKTTRIPYQKIASVLYFKKQEKFFEKCKFLYKETEKLGFTAVDNPVVKLLTDIKKGTNDFVAEIQLPII